MSSEQESANTSWNSENIWTYQHLPRSGGGYRSHAWQTRCDAMVNDAPNMHASFAPRSCIVHINRPRSSSPSFTPHHESCFAFSKTSIEHVMCGAFRFSQKIPRRGLCGLSYDGKSYKKWQRTRYGYFAVISHDVIEIRDFAQTSRRSSIARAHIS